MFISCQWVKEFFRCNFQLHSVAKTCDTIWVASILPLQSWYIGKKCVFSKNETSSSQELWDMVALKHSEYWLLNNLHQKLCTVMVPTVFLCKNIFVVIFKEIQVFVCIWCNIDPIFFSPKFQMRQCNVNLRVSVNLVIGVAVSLRS